VPLFGNPAATAAEEVEIDRLVYELYGLSEEEIAIVEGEKYFHTTRR